MGTAQGWETRRRREKLREKEWEDAIALAAREDERSRIRREMTASIDALQPASLDNVALFDSIRRQLRRDLDHVCPPDTPEPG